MTERKDDFDFYLKFAKQLILSLSDVKDRILASAWIQKLRDEEVGSPKLRTDYLKLLLFTLQRKHLVGPFAQNPADIQVLEEFPHSFKLHDIAKALIEEEYAERQKSAGDSPPISGECSADLLEYAASQDIPNFGVQLYYAISNEPIHKWTRLNTAFFPKQELDILEKSAIPSVSATTHMTSGAHSETGVGDASSPSQPKPQESEISVDSSRQSKKTQRASSPIISLLGDKPAEEEEIRQPPTWGSNLFSVTDPPEKEYDLPDIDLEEYCNIEGIDVEQLRKDLETDVDCLEFDEDEDDVCIDDAIDGDAGEMDFDIKFGIGDDKEFDDYIEMLKQQEEELLAELAQDECSQRRKSPSPRRKGPSLDEHLEMLKRQKEELLAEIAQEECSPRRKSPSPRRKEPSPKMKTPSPRQKEPSPKMKTPSPQRREPSPKPEISEKLPQKREFKSRLQKPGFASKLKRPASQIKKTIEQGSKATEDIIKDANETMKKELSKLGQQACNQEDSDSDSASEADVENEGIAVRKKVNIAVQQAKKLLETSPAFGKVPVTTPAKSPSPKRVTNLIGDAEFILEDDILDEDFMQSEFDYLEPLSTLQKVQMEVPLIVEASSSRPVLAKPTTSRLPTPKYVPPTHPQPCVTRKGKALASGRPAVKGSGRQAFDVDRFDECLPDGSESSGTVTVRLEHRKVTIDNPEDEYRPSTQYDSYESPCSGQRITTPQRSPSSPQHRYIPPFEFKTPPRYSQPSAREKSPSLPCPTMSPSDDGLLSMESMELYESPSPERPVCSPSEAAARRVQAECYERQLFEESDALTESIFDDEQLDFEEIMTPAEKYSYDFMSELRQMPSKYQPTNIPLEQQWRSNVARRKDLAQYPRVPRPRRGKTTKRCYGQPPRVDTIKEYYEGPTEPVYASPRRRVPPVYPSVITPPSAERDPFIYPELHRFEAPQQQQQQPCDFYPTTPKSRQPSRKGFNRRPRKLNLDEDDNSLPCDPEPYYPEGKMPLGEKTVTVRLEHRKVIHDNSPQDEYRPSSQYESFESPCPGQRSTSPQRSPSSPQHRFIPPFEYKTPPRYNQPPVRKKSPSISCLAMSSLDDDILSMESMELYESPSPERPVCSPSEAAARRVQAECYERQLFEESDALSESILDDEQLDFEEILTPAEKYSFDFMSELRQMPSKYQPTNIPLEQQWRSNVARRQNLGQYPRVPRQRRGKTTKRCYGQPPQVDTIKEYYEGPTEPVYASPRRRVPPVYPSVITPPSAERDPYVYPEFYRFEPPQQQQQGPCDLYTTTPKSRQPRRKDFNRRPRRLNFDEDDTSVPCEPETYYPERIMPLGENVAKRIDKVEKMFPSQSSFASEREVREAIYKRPRPSDLITFKLGEYDYYVSPPKPSVLDEDVPAWGLQKPLLPYEYGWKSPPNLPTVPPDRVNGPNKTTVIRITPGGNTTMRIEDEQLPYNDWVFEESDLDSLRPQPRPSAATGRKEDTSLENQMEFVENILEEYQRDMDEQRQSIISKLPAPRRQMLRPGFASGVPQKQDTLKATSPVKECVPSSNASAKTVVQKTNNQTPPMVAARRLALQRKLFHTFNELDDLFDDTAEETYKEEDVSPLSQPLSLYKFREDVRTKGSDARYSRNARKKRRRRNLAETFSVRLPEFPEEDCDQFHQSSPSYKPPNPKLDYLTVLGVDDDVDMVDFCD